MNPSSGPGNNDFFSSLLVFFERPKAFLCLPS